MDGPPRTSFGTDHLPARRRYEVFREAIGVVYEVSSPTREGEDFHASMESTLADQILFITCETVGQKFRRSSAHIGQDGLDHFQIQIFSEGTNHITEATHRSHSSTRDLLFIDTAQPYEAVTTDFTNHTLVVPRHRLSAKLRAPDEHNGRSLSGKVPLAQLAQDHLRRLFRALPHLPHDQLTSAIEPTLDLVAAAFNGVFEPDSPGEQAVHRALGERIRTYIDGHIGFEDLSSERLCAEFRVSRSTLYRIFHQYGGVASYVRNRRLDSAMRLLSSPHAAHLSVTDIATQSGFHSDRAFRLAFKRRFGGAPTDARAACPRAAKDDEPHADLLWVDWYRGL